jgi:predicted lipid-binding transport protein (Tim44 family)
MTSADNQDTDHRPVDRRPDWVAEQTPGRAPGKAAVIAEHLVPFGTSIVRELGEVAELLAKEDEAEDRFLEGFDRAIHEQPSPVAAGVDLTPLRAVEPDFDPFNFRTLARETFLKIREARGSMNRHADDGLLSETMERELNDVIDGDVASHRHHILSQLEVVEATIVSASVVDGRERVGMRFIVGAEEIVRDAATDQIVTDDHLVHRWAELWQFDRDPSVDSSATDEQHVLSFGPDRWLFAHRGWVVTGITRLEDPMLQPKYLSDACKPPPSARPLPDRSSLSSGSN